MKNFQLYINKKKVQINKSDLKSDFLQNLSNNFTKTNKQNYHPYHIVDTSPWPFLISFGLFFFTFGLAMFFHGYTGSNLLSFTGFLIIILTMYTWFRDIIREAVFEGKHTKQVQIGLRNGMLLFIFSELLFFISFFWAFFHSSLSPTPEIGSLWPPLGIKTINPWNIPLLNTIILLTSGATITWSHNAIICGNREYSILSLILTLLLAIFFIFIQAFEYIESPFNISDSIFGTTFFLLTGFHGIHVIIGFIFILISTLRLINYHFSKQHHFGFEASAWYWHFVDVIWLFLFVSLYWWGGF